MAENSNENPGAVKGGQAVAEIPAESRWTIATQGLTGAYVATVKAMLDAVGRDKYNEMMAQIWAEAGKSSKQIADAPGRPILRDCS